MTFFISYIAGVLAVLIATMWTASREPSAHGQSIIVPMGCALAFLWPIALIWFAVVGLWLGGRWIMGKGWPE